MCFNKEDNRPQNRAVGCCVFANNCLTFTSIAIRIPKQNLSTNLGYDDFEFVKEGEIYDCKMELFGEFSDKSAKSGTEVTVVESGVIAGETKYFKVMIGSDVYYILESDAKMLS